MNKQSNAQQIPTFQPDGPARFRVTNTTHVYNNNHALIFIIVYIQLRAVTPSASWKKWLLQWSPIIILVLILYHFWVWLPSTLANPNLHPCWSVEPLVSDWCVISLPSPGLVQHCHLTQFNIVIGGPRMLGNNWFFHHPLVSSILMFLHSCLRSP